MSASTSSFRLPDSALFQQARAGWDPFLSLGRVRALFRACQPICHRGAAYSIQRTHPETTFHASLRLLRRALRNI